MNGMAEMSANRHAVIRICSSHLARRYPRTNESTHVRTRMFHVTPHSLDGRYTCTRATACSSSLEYTRSKRQLLPRSVLAEIGRGKRNRKRGQKMCQAFTPRVVVVSVAPPGNLDAEHELIIHAKAEAGSSAKPTDRGAGVDRLRVLGLRADHPELLLCTNIEHDVGRPCCLHQTRPVRKPPKTLSVDAARAERRNAAKSNQKISLDPQSPAVAQLGSAQCSKHLRQRPRRRTPRGRSALRSGAAHNTLLGRRNAHDEHHLYQLVLPLAIAEIGSEKRVWDR